MRERARYAILFGESDVEQLVIRDLGPWDKYPTVTNDVDRVIADLWLDKLLWEGRRLFYYDSLGARDEILHFGKRFMGFRCGTTQALRHKRCDGGAS